MEGTKNENTIYRVVHPEKGPNIFLIVPHGSERVGTDVAIERINMPIKKGSLTIVPIAVPEAYRKNTRAIEGQDINNRFFDKSISRTDTDKLAKEYMDMLDEYDIDDHIIFNSIWMIRMNSFSGWTFFICYRNEWIM